MKALISQTLNLELDDATITQLERFGDLLLDWNEKVNLTAITDPGEVRIRHLLDSLTILTLPDLPDSPRVIDVGTGGGVPGIPLKIARPNWRMILMDSTRKKIDVVNAMIQQLKLERAFGLQMRAEEAGQDKLHREAYDLVIARSVARMPVLAEYLLPLCAVGGMCIAMKGDTVQEEMDDADYAIQVLGGKRGDVHEVQLPGGVTHYLAVIHKVKPTPRDYPRRPGTPSKFPLVEGE
jgi:16S rRNA (guanine527-N7)-methyltransferase